MSWAVELVIVLGLTVLNGVFAAAEIAIVAVRASRVTELALESERGAALARLRDNPERLLATVQIGITVVTASTAAFGGATWARELAAVLVRVGVSDETAEGIALVAVVVAVSYLSLVLGELVPKSLALKWSERYALWIARPLYALSRIGAPFVWLLTASSNLVLRQFGDETSFVESEVSRDELSGIIDRAGSAGNLSPRAAKIASRAVALDELNVASVMIPRASMVTLDADAGADELGRVLDTTEEERLVVRRGSDDDVRYVTTRDLARVLGGRVPGGLATVLRPVLVVPRAALALDVLEQLQTRRVPIAMVVGESGGLEGMADIDDLAEELVGTLLVGPPTNEPAIVHEGDGIAVVPATLRIHVANRELGIELPRHRGWSTIGGLVLAELGRIPTAGTRLRVAPALELEIVEASERRIERIRIRSGPGNVADRS